MEKNKRHGSNAAVSCDFLLLNDTVTRFTAAYCHENQNIVKIIKLSK